MSKPSASRPAPGRALASPGPPLARITELTVSFPGQARRAVDRLSATIRAGECVALVGESGSGKSLTARALLGLLPETALVSGLVELATGTEWQHRLDAVPARRSRDWHAIRGRHAAFVMQDALGGLDPLRRIEHEVGDPLRLHRLASGADRRRLVIEALIEAGMPQPVQRIRQRSDELSGGLRQRTLVASALVADPRLIIADEPTTALDASRRRHVLARLRARVDSGAGALLISHDLDSVRDFADRVIVLRNGAVLEEGATEAVFTSPGHPFTRELLSASPAGVRRGTRILHAPTGERTASGIAAATERDAENRHARTRGKPAVARLELRGIRAGYGRGGSRRNVLDGASLAIGSGETLGLLGESGSGKTTLLRVALGLHPAADGRILIDGTDLAGASPRQRRALRRRVAFVPQDPLGSFPRGAHGRRLLTDALRAVGIPRAERLEQAHRLGDEVHLTRADLDRPAATLSGGQRQRLAIARALALAPEILLLDEPVSALDVTVQARVLDLLDELQESRGTSYLLVAHDEDVIRHMSDRVLRLDGGSLIDH